MIEEAYVSFEVAKLLKEKGFDEYCHYFYDCETPNTGYLSNKKYGESIHNSKVYDGRNLVACPTHQVAMAWLREVHGIFIGISLCQRYENKTDNDTIIMFFFELLNLKEKQLINGFSQEYTHTYEEAVESALKYVLENLI